MEIVLVIALILFLYKIQYGLYLKNCFKNLELEFKFEDEAIFEGEKTKLKQTFINKKWLPLWWIRIQYMISNNISFEQSEEKKISKLELRSEELSLFGYEKLEREMIIIGRKRGYYKLENLDVLCSDLLVTDKFVKKYHISEALYVFPKLITNLEFGIQFKRLIGDVIIKKHLIYDPYEKKGIRNYDAYDSIKDINWLASARSNELKVNIYNYTASQEILIFLSCQKENDWVSDNVVEECISMAATIYDQFSRMGIKVGLITDCIDPETNSNIAVEAGCEENHGFLFNQNLAKICITECSKNNISNYINEEIINENRGPLWIIISSITRNGIKEAFYNARENNFDIKWILPRQANAEKIPENLDEVLIWDVSL